MAEFPIPAAAGGCPQDFFTYGTAAPASGEKKLKLFCMPPSTCSRRVLMTLFELGMAPGVDYALHLVHFGKGEQKSEEHLKRQPFGKVPVWGEEEWSIYESRAITRHIATRHAKPGSIQLMPSDPRLLAEVEQWISCENNNFYTAAMQMYFNEVLAKRKGLPVMEGATEAGAKTLKEGVLPVLDAALTGQSWLVGNTFSMADLGFAPYLQAVIDSGGQELIDGFPAVSAWSARLLARESWVAAVGVAVAGHL